MNKKTLIILPIILIALAISLVKGVSYYKQNSQVSAGVSKTDLVLDLDFGNNDGSSTVYDTLGYNRNATSTGAPTFTNDYVALDGSSDYLTLPSTDVYNTSNVSIAVKFSPDFDTDNNVRMQIIDSTLNGRYSIIKDENALSNTLRIFLGNTQLVSIAEATYSPFWKTGEENVLIIRGTSGDTDAWLNGDAILTDNSSAWTPDNPSTIYIGASYLGTQKYDGKIHYLKIWQRLLTDNEVQALSADRETTSQSSQKRGLVGYWTMDTHDVNSGVHYDKSGYQTLATSTGITQAVGKIGQSGEFDQSTSFIDIKDEAIFDLTDGFFISMWVQMDDANSDAPLNQYFLIKGYDGAPSTFSYSINIVNAGDETNDYLTCKASNGTDSYGTVSATLVKLSSFLPDTWYHLACRFSDSAGSVGFFRDGELVASNLTFSGTLNDVANDIFIGKRMDNTRYFDGKIDDVRIYNYVFSSEEILKLYNSAKKKHSAAAPKVGLVGYWNMDANDTSASTHYDKSAYDNHGNACCGALTLATGTIKQAIDFPGTVDMMLVWDSTTAPAIYRDIGNNNAYTVSAWFKTATGTGTGAGWWTADTIMEIRVEDVSDQETPFNLGVTESVVEIRRGESGAVYEGEQGSTVVSDNQWHHAVVTINDDDYVIYVDGVEDGSGSFTTATGDCSVGTQTSNFSIGSRTSNAGEATHFFEGLVDEARVYNRALSADEVAGLYNARKKAHLR